VSEVETGNEAGNEALDEPSIEDWADPSDEPILLADVLAEERALAATRYPIDKLFKALKANGKAEISARHLSYIGLIIQDLAKRLKRPIAVVAPRAADARELHGALQSFEGSGEAFLLGPPDVSPYAGVTPDRALALDRIAALWQAGSLSAGDVLVTSALGWARKGVPHEALTSRSLSLAVEEEVDVDHVKAVLVASGYSHVSLVEDEGTFSVRGDIIDIYPPFAEQPVRLELYGDLIETMKAFDPVTQRGGDSIATLHVHPAREEILDEETLASAREKLQRLGESLMVPSSKTSAILRDLKAGVRFFGIEGFAPALFPELQPLYERLPDDTCVLVIEPDEVEAELESYLEARNDEYARESENGELVFAPTSFLLTEEELHASLHSVGPTIDVRRLPEDPETAISFPALDNADLVRRRKQHTNEGVLPDLFKHIQTWRERYGRIVFVCASRGTADRLAGLIRNHGGNVSMHREPLDLSGISAPPCDHYEVVIGELRDGFRSPSRGVAVVTDRELLGRSSRRSSRAAAQEATAIASFKELQPGDLVVHIDFGVARYRGLERMDAGGVDGDFLALEYADNARLYLPVYRLNRVQRYAGSNQFTRLDKLGGTTWERTKAKVRAQLADIAEELLRIYAERKTKKGFQYSAPGEMFDEFEAEFPYEETPHQEQAIHDVISDMTSERPMDRLLCGDVGFGKTEVAMRAAFKAVIDGKQVAVLVPTTVLAEQHLKSFSRRMAHAPIRVAALSRFRSTAEAKEIMTATAEGKVDILIGTHRLLSKELKYKDLGLLVVDEEQRFGVTHKEKIKALRATVDVLTMTATPIPRTLESAMLGIRDLSVILTPPPGRLAVRTHVAKFKEATVREAITAELERGGQVYFVHNRVDTIHNIAEELRRIVPSAKIAVGHAQMRDQDLEQVMVKFLNRDTNVLVTTTIIESGIDISTANTIFVNDADRFGLAQLHQLRGRVGRGSQRAYCYLLVKDPKRLNEDAKRRLEVLQQHTELGAGIHIAHHDLDMRGAGNILGRDQSGHVESIGFELYSELLEEAIADLKGQPAEENFEPEVKIPVGAFIPERCIVDVQQRLLFYKRYSLASTDAELYDVHAELEERYGAAPTTVEALRDICQLKLTMKRIGAAKIEAGPKSVVVELLPSTRLAPDKVMALLRENAGTYQFRPEMTLIRRLSGAESTNILASALRVAREITDCIA
jgi:transcription-repair coupling factor (superfamily II helicase)